MAEKYLDYSGTDLLWRKIVKLLNKKLESVENADSSITVTDKNRIAVRVSASDKNLIQVKSEEGLYVEAPKLEKLKFGADKTYVYDGTQEVVVPVYMGEIT